jgi:hypothetical protein
MFPAFAAWTALALRAFARWPIASIRTRRTIRPIASFRTIATWSSRWTIATRWTFAALAPSELLGDRLERLVVVDQIEQAGLARLRLGAGDRQDGDAVELDLGVGFEHRTGGGTFGE